MKTQFIKGPDISFEELEKKLTDPKVRLIIVNLPGRLNESCTEEPLCLLSALFENVGVEEWAVSKMRPVYLKEAFNEQDDEIPLSREIVINDWNKLEEKLFMLRHAEKKIALYVPNNAEISALTQTMKDLVINVQQSGDMQLITRFLKEPVYL